DVVEADHLQSYALTAAEATSGVCHSRPTTMVLAPAAAARPRASSRACFMPASPGSAEVALKLPSGWHAFTSDSSNSFKGVRSAGAGAIAQATARSRRADFIVRPPT